jgi:isocitrate dehydrogenase
MQTPTESHAHHTDTPQHVRAAVTVIPGDGIGPEVMEATRAVLDAAGAQIDWEECVAGSAAFAAGITTGVPEETLASITRTGVVLKGPLETPIGFGGKSANVTLRKMFEVYGNLRPAKEIPGVRTPFSGRNIDLIVVRENIEDLYAGIEHMQTMNTAQCLKLMTRTGCEKIIRLAFEVARAEGRSSVHCATKANIMKLSEGLLKRTFERVATEYPDIAAHHVIIDNCAHQLVINPEQFEVIVTSNMNGDIISDLTSGLVGGLGVAPSFSIGDGTAIFEPVHGSAPDIAGKDMANPVAMMLTSVHMLRHVGQSDVARVVEDAVLYTLEQGGVMTGDLARNREGVRSVGTREFAQHVADNLGQHPSTGPARTTRPLQVPTLPEFEAQPATRELVGVDIFIEAHQAADQLGPAIERATTQGPLKFKMLSNRGTVVWPAQGGDIDTVEHWRCRFRRRDDDMLITDADIAELLIRVATVAPWMHVEKLHTFNGELGFSLAQGET